MKVSPMEKGIMKLSYLWIYMFVVFLSGGCISKKKILYFNEGSFSPTPKIHQPLICQKGDLLDIKVYSVNQDIVAPFNQFLVTNTKEDKNQYLGYLVDETNAIVLPLLGKLQVGGQTFEQIESMITNKLKDYVKDAVVSVKLINFEVTVLGEVGSPGLVHVQNAQTNLIEVLGLAGDIGINGEREDIVVIRSEEGKRQEFHLNITQKNIFDQEGFYLHQNDIVYVSPNASRRQASAINPMRVSMVLTMSTIIGSIILTLILR